MRRTIPRVLLALAACVLTACHSPAYPVAHMAPPRPAHAVLSTAPGTYVGAYENDPQMEYAPYQVFAAATGHSPRILVNYSSFFEHFPVELATTAAEHGAVPCIQIQPYGISLRSVVAGSYDTWLRSYASAVRTYRRPVIIGFGHEMNGSWYSWGYHRTPAATWVAAWRHIVLLFRGQGADNVTWLWTVNRTNPGTTGRLRNWWPGGKFVTWVGIDGYYYLPSDTFGVVFGKTIAQLRAFTSKPLLLSETGVGRSADQPKKIRDLFTGMRQYQTLGLVWFDVAQHQGIYHQDWRLEDNPRAAAAFGREVKALKGDSK